MSINVSIPDAAAYGDGEALPTRVIGQDVLDAAYATAHHYPGGLASLAVRMGMSANTLAHKVNLGNTTHHLTLREAVTMQAMSGNAAILHAMADQLGYTCTLATPDQTGGDPVEAVMRLQVEQADFMRAVADPLIAGPNVSKNAMRRAEYQASELTASICRVVAMLRGRMRREPGGAA